MSKMAELDMEIRDRLMDGDRPSVIATELNVPIVWVYDIMKDQMSEVLSEEYSPYKTVNS